MTRHEVPTVWTIPARNHVGHRQVRAMRHRQVRRLLPPMTWRRRGEYAAVALIGGVIGVVSAFAILAGLYFFFKLVDTILRAALGGS